MDIFNKLSKQAIDTYLSEYLAKIGVPEFIQLDRTRKLSERGDSMNCAASETERDCIYRELSSFYRAAKNPNPFFYFSKLEFVMMHEDNKDFWTQELFLKLISDRSFFFYEHRRYACQEAGLHTLVEHDRNLRNYDLKAAWNQAEFEPIMPGHMDYYHEYQQNYKIVTNALECRGQLIRLCGSLVDEVNRVGQRCKDLAKRSANSCPRNDFLFAKLFRIAGTYIGSVVQQTRNESYEKPFCDIFIRKDPSALDTFNRGIQAILELITLPNGETHCLASIIVYQIFTRNTTAFLQGDVGKFWSRVTRCSKAVRVIRMTEITGRKAGVNLALFCELCSVLKGTESNFHSLYQKIRLTEYDSEELQIEPQREQIDAKENVRKDYQDTVDFLFYLTTGYGRLFHCLQRSLHKSEQLSEICIHIEVEESCEWPVFCYKPDYRHPVDQLGYILNSYIDDCFANRVEFLTPGIFAQQTQSELVGLTNLVLQDMALPAAQRLSRIIRKTLSEKPDIQKMYVSVFREFHESSVINKCLQEIMDVYFPNIEELIPRYQAVETRVGHYDYHYILRALIEYELRYQLYQDGSKILRNIAKEVIPKNMFATPVFD